MNILIAADYATPASGNFIASVLELGLYLREHGDSLTFLFPKNRNTKTDTSWVHWLEENGFVVYLLDKAAAEEEQLRFLESVIHKHQIELLHLHFGMLHSIVVHRARQLGVKILMHDHMDFAAGSSRKKQAVRCAMRALIYRKNGIGIVSVNPYKNRAYFPARNWYVPNALSLRRNTEQSLTREECRREIGLKPEEKMCLLLGWDVHRKGLDIAVKAIRELRKTDPNMLLGVVGIGEPPDPDRLEFIRTTTGEDPACGWIRFLPSREDMFAYHRAIDVYLSASRSEAFSYGILETISQNTPVAVSDIKGTSWCWRYDKAVVYPTENVIACAKAIQKAMNMGRAVSNYESFLEEYDIQEWCKQMRNIYLKMLK